MSAYFRSIASTLDSLEFTKVIQTLQQQHTEVDYNPFDIDLSQCIHFNPLFHVLGKHDSFLSTTTTDDVQLQSRYRVLDLHTVYDTVLDQSVPRAVHVKSSPLINPIHLGCGKYRSHSSFASFPLPRRIESNPPLPGNRVVDKIYSPMNTSYVDAFFTFLSHDRLASYGFRHTVEYYGAVSTIQRHFRMDLYADYDFMSHFAHFQTHDGTLWTTQPPTGVFACPPVYPPIEEEEEEEGSTTKLPPLAQKQSTRFFSLDDDDDEPENALHDTTTDDIEPMAAPSSSSSVFSDITDDNSSYADIDEAGIEEEWYSDDDEEGDDNDGIPDLLAFSTQDQYQPIPDPCADQQLMYYFTDVPVQLIFMEKCDHVLDKCFNQGMFNSAQSMAMMGQLLMILATYQKAFSFTHNDLHTNNIMYNDCTDPFLYYRFQQSIYRFPTYGRLFKIIDFGRSIYSFEGQRYCVDSYQHGEDADGQYNCAPFINPAKPIVEPNPSFDLFRFAITILAELQSSFESLELAMDDSFVTLLHHVCMDKHGKHIMFREDGALRCLDFKAYKYAGQTLHQGIPAQLIPSFLSTFQVPPEEVDPTWILMDIDAIPDMSTKSSLA
jgi:hypothetical protein